MKRLFGHLTCSILTLVLVSGCGVQTIRLDKPINFETGPGEPIPAFIGVVITDETANYAFGGVGPGRSGMTGSGVNIFLGQAVKENIGIFLKSLFRDVAVSGSIETLPPDVTNVAIMRFSSGNELHMPMSIFEDSRLTVALELEVLGKGEQSWKINSKGVAVDKHPLAIGGIIGISISTSFYKNLTVAGVKAAFDDLAMQIRTRRDAWSPVSK